VDGISQRIVDAQNLNYDLVPDVSHLATFVWPLRDQYAIDVK
jgi:hypothetical protein